MRPASLSFHRKGPFTVHATERGGSVQVEEQEEAGGEVHQHY